MCEAEIYLAGGRLTEAVAAADAGLRLAAQTGNRGLLPRGHVVMAVCSVHSLDLTTGLLYANRLRDAALLGQENLIRGSASGSPPRPWRPVTASRRGPSAEGHPPPRRAHPRVAGVSARRGPWLVRAGQRLGDTDLAECAVRAMHRLALMNRSFRSVRAAAEHATGLYAGDADALEAASERHLDPWARASALEDASRVRSARVAERGQAVDLLRRAADAYLAAGASGTWRECRADCANSTTTAADRPAAGPGSAGSPTPSSRWPSWSARDSPTAEWAASSTSPRTRWRSISRRSSASST
ncbi:hypothetical protein NKH77_33860 [Streptomyces sp. M19]